MQMHQLAYFVAVARSRHFTRAAEECGISQPSLSKQIRVLENALGAPLFVRGRGSVELTSAGEALLPHAQRILIDLEGARQAVREVAGLQRGRVRLGATPSLCDGLLPEVLPLFRERHPGIELEIAEGGSGPLTRDLAQGKLDLALLIVPLRTAAPDLETTVLLHEELVLASPVTAGLPGEVDISVLRDVDLVMYREGYDLREVTLQACADAGFTPHLSVEGVEMNAALRFVEAGLGYAVVPQMVVSTRPGLRASRLLRRPLRRTIAVAHRSEHIMPLAARTFRAELLDLFDVAS